MGLLKYLLLGLPAIVGMVGLLGSIIGRRRSRDEAALPRSHHPGDPQVTRPPRPPDDDD